MADLTAEISNSATMSAEVSGTTYVNSGGGSVSPVVDSVTTKSGGVSTTTITITDAEGTKTDQIIVSDGAQGLTGPQGPAGPAGADGKDGAQGAAGKDGSDGVQGPIGLTGPQGPKGDTGAQGPQGEVGPSGKDGAQGPIGLTGPAGADGAQGPQGIQGEKGDTGATGAAGKDADVSQFYTKTEIDAKIGDVATALAAIVGGA